MFERHRREFSVMVAILAILAVLAVAAPGFFTFENQIDLLLGNMPVLIVGLGMTLVILTGHIDISVGSQFAICGVAAGVLAKMGFPVPLGAWFRGQFRSIIDDYVLAGRALGRGFFEPAFVRQLVGEHQAGTHNHSERLWMLVNFEMWLRQFFDGEEIAEPQLTLAETASMAY